MHVLHLRYNTGKVVGGAVGQHHAVDAPAAAHRCRRGQVWAGVPDGGSMRLFVSTAGRLQV